MESVKKAHILLCDIGATNSRFHLSAVKTSDLPPSIRNFYFPDTKCPASDPEKVESGKRSVIFNSKLPLDFWKFNEEVLEVLHEETYSSQAFISMAGAIQNFFEKLPSTVSVSKSEILACISICGPVEGQAVKSMANLGWKDVSGEALKALGFRDVYLANDFEAFGYGLARASSVDQLTPLFQATDLLDSEGNLMKEAREFGAIDFEKPPAKDFDFDSFFAKAEKKVLVVGIGTGVGTVMVRCYQNFGGTASHLEVMPSEAGHCFFGFKDDRDVALVNYIARVRYKDLEREYLPFEYLISGLSIPLLYSFLSEGQRACGLSGKQIFQKCLEKDPVAIETVKYFLALLGQFVHQTAICFLPEQVVLRGPVVDSLREVLAAMPELKWSFWRSLLAKSHMSSAYQNLTVFTVREQFNLSALGAVIMFAEKCGVDAD